MVMLPVWNGTEQESSELLLAIAHNCSCTFGVMGVRLTTCPSHELLTDSQRVLDHLVFSRRQVTQWVREEFTDDRLLT